LRRSWRKFRRRRRRLPPDITPIVEQRAYGASGGPSTGGLPSALMTVKTARFVTPRRAHLQIHSGMQAEQRKEVLDTFTSDGGLLVITTSASKGVSLNFVGVVIHYDLPVSVAAFAQREGSNRDWKSPILQDIYLGRRESCLPARGLTNSNGPKCFPRCGLRHRQATSRRPRATPRVK
jgi:hypothetical protein